MAKQFIWIIFISLVFFACSGKTIRDGNEYTTYYESGDYLCKQRIYNSSKVLYKYIDYGKMAWSSWHYGTFILDSTENVNHTKFINDLLPFYYTKFICDSNVIEAIELFYSNDEPSKEGMYEKIVNGITYKVKRYYTKQGSGMGLDYTYRTLLETKDSIFFEKLTVDNFGIKIPEKTGFRKGNITVEEDSLGFVKKIKLEILNQYPFWEKMNNAKVGDTIWTNDNVFKGEDQIHLSPFSLVYSFDITLTPDSLSKKQKISNYGVFKRVVSN